MQNSQKSVEKLSARQADLARYCDKAAEAATLASMIVDDACIPEVMLRISKEAFYLPEHQLIYDALRRLWIEANRKYSATGEREKIDGVLLRSKLTELGYLDNDSEIDRAGGFDYLVKVIESVPSAANAIYYADQIRKKAKEREVIQLAEDIGTIANEPGDSDEKLQHIQTRVLEVEPFKATERFIRFADRATDIALILQDKPPGLIKTGFHNVDRIIGGFCPGEMLIVGSRPSMGKTSFALNVALKVAQADKAVLFFSLEMSIEAIIQRALCTLAKVDLGKIRRGESLDEDERESLHEYSIEIRDRQLPLIFSNVGYTPAEQLNIIRQQKRVQELALIVVDYVQLMSSAQQQKDLRHTVTEVSKQLKQSGINENIPVLVLSQLSREPEGRDKHRPRMSDLRESGSLEQDADVVMLLHREDYYHSGEADYKTDHICDIIIDKNRSGQTGTAKLVFVPEYTQFADLTEIKEAQELEFP